MWICNESAVNDTRDWSNPAMSVLKSMSVIAEPRFKTWKSKPLM